MNAVAVADDVAAVLNLGTFSLEFIARVCFVPLVPLEEASTALRVEVIPPPALVLDRISRGSWRQESPIALGIIKKLAAAGEAARETETAVLVGFIEELLTYLTHNDVLPTTGAVLLRVEPLQLFNADALVQRHEVLAVVMLHYQLFA